MFAAPTVDHRIARARGLLLVLLPFASGCGQILGVSSYTVSDECPAGQYFASSGRCTAVAVCAPDELPPTCALKIGAAANGGCASGSFEADLKHPPGGCDEIFGCADASSLAGLGTNSCADGFSCEPDFSTSVPARVVGLFVQASAAPGGDGKSRKAPFRKIQDAIDAAAALPQGIPPDILLAQGTYSEGPLVISTPVAIFGTCVHGIVIQPRSDASPGPVIDIRPDASGTTMTGFTVSGPTATVGIRVDGAEHVGIGDQPGGAAGGGYGVIIGPVGGPGVSFEDTSGPASGSVKSASIHDARGAGVAAYGATLSLSEIQIVNTQPGSDGGRGVGLLALPSVSQSTDRLPAGGYWDGTKTRRSNVNIASSRISGAYGAGIAVEGSDVTVTATSIENVVEDELGRGAGLRVEPRWSGFRPATLTMTHSLIANVQGEGVHLDDVDAADIEYTTIRDIQSTSAAPQGASDGGAIQFGGCQGNGVRVRSRGLGFDGADAGALPTVTLDHLLIDGVSESGVHVEGASVTLSNSLIRNVRPCGKDFGDGVAAYGYPFSAASVRVENTRITDVARAAVARFDADVSLEASSLEACEGLVTAKEFEGGTARVDSTQPSFCACGGKWAACAAAEGSFGSALAGFGKCDPATALCIAMCPRDFNEESAGQLANYGASIGWAPDFEGAASAFSPGGGCMTAAAPPNGEFRFLELAQPPGPDKNPSEPVVDLWRSSGAGSAARLDDALVEESSFSGLHVLEPNLPPPDGRNALFLVFQVLRRPGGPVDARTQLVGSGVLGVSGELLDAHKLPVPTDANPWAQPLYSASTSPSPEPLDSGLSVSQNGTGYFWNVPPGDYFIRLVKPAGSSSMTCVPGPGLALGWPVPGEPNVYRARAVGGVVTVAVRAYCTVQ